MLNKKPEKRYQTPGEVIAALAPWLSDDGGTKVVAGLSGTDLAGSGTLQNTLNEIVSGGTKRIGTARLGAVEAVRTKGIWIGVGAAVALAAGVTAFAVFGGFGKSDKSETAATPPPPAPQQSAPKATANKKAPDQTKDQSKTAPAPAAKAGPTYKVDFSSMKPDEIQLRGKQSTSTTIGDSPLPADWNVNHHRKDVDADYLVSDVAGARAVGIRHVSGPGGAQIQYKGEIIRNKLAPGDMVTIRFHYQFEGQGRGSASIQQDVFPFRRHSTADLTPTNGQWRATEVVVTKPDTDPLSFIFNTGGAGGAPAPGNTVWLRDVEIQVKPAERVVYDLDLSKQKPFTVRGRIKQSDPRDNRTKVWVTSSRIGDGDVPPGWTFRSYNIESIVEYMASPIGGGMAVGMKTIQPPGSAMMYTPSFEAPTGRIKLRFEYRTEGGSSKDFLVRFVQEKPERKGAWTVRQIDPSGGEWATSEYEVDLRGATRGYFEIHNVTVSTNVVFWLRALTLIEPAVLDPPAPERPAVATPGVSTREAARTLFTFDSSKLAVGRYTIENREQKGQSFFPEGWFGHCWKADSIAEFVSRDSAFGMTNLNSSLSAQLLVFLEKHLGVELTVGKEYRIKVEYRAANDAAGKLIVRGPNYEGLGEAPLTRGDVWKTAELVFRRVNGKPVELMFENTAVGEGNTLWVRKFEVEELK
jgi:hypothetical protein